MSAGPAPSRPSWSPSRVLLTWVATFAVGAGLGLLATWIRGPAPVRERAATDTPPAAAGADPAQAGPAPALPAWPGGSGPPVPGTSASTGTLATPALLEALGPLGESASRCAADSGGARGGATREVWVSLDVQTLDGAVRVVDARPPRGAGRLASCVRAEMVGRQVPLAEARAGGIFKLTYPVRY